MPRYIDAEKLKKHYEWWERNRKRPENGGPF